MQLLDVPRVRGASGASRRPAAGRLRGAAHACPETSKAPRTYHGAVGKCRLSARSGRQIRSL